MFNIKSKKEYEKQDKEDTTPELTPIGAKLKHTIKSELLFANRDIMCEFSDMLDKFKEKHKEEFKTVEYVVYFCVKGHGKIKAYEGIDAQAIQEIKNEL